MTQGAETPAGSNSGEQYDYDAHDLRAGWAIRIEEKCLNTTTLNP